MCRFNCQVRGKLEKVILRHYISSEYHNGTYCNISYFVISF